MYRHWSPVPITDNTTTCSTLCYTSTCILYAYCYIETREELNKQRLNHRSRSRSRERHRRQRGSDDDSDSNRCFIIVMTVISNICNVCSNYTPCILCSPQRSRDHQRKRKHKHKAEKKTHKHKHKHKKHRH